MKNGMMCLSLFLMTLSAQAAIIGTYVDADLTNVAAPPEGLANQWYAYDGQWGLSAIDQFGYNNNAFIADNLHNGFTPPVSENPSPITMAISGLAQGTYDVYMVYIVRNDINNSTCHIQTALNNGAFETYSYQDGSYDQTYWDVWDSRQVKLGTVSNATGFSVTVDNLPSTGLGDWSIFDGVSYVAVPEPATLGLVFLGSLLLRRKK